MGYTSACLIGVNIEFFLDFAQSPNFDWLSSCQLLSTREVQVSSLIPNDVMGTRLAGEAGPLRLHRQSMAYNQRINPKNQSIKYACFTFIILRASSCLGPSTQAGLPCPCPPGAQTRRWFFFLTALSLSISFLG